MNVKQSKITRRVAKRIEQAQLDLITNIFKIPLEGALLLDELPIPCELMSLECFDLPRCIDYCRSGSRTCNICRFRPGLRSISESRKNGVMSAVFS